MISNANNNRSRSNIKRERISIDHRTQFGSNSTLSNHFQRFNSNDNFFNGLVSNDPRFFV